MELYAAACACDAAKVEELLTASSTSAVDINRRVGPREETPLHAACRSPDGEVACCRLLVAARADPSVLCVHGGSCLHQAAQFVNDGALVEILRSCTTASARADLANVQDKNGWTALHAAVYKPSRSGMHPLSRVNIVKELLRARANVGVQNAAGQTALELAVASGCNDGAQAILEAEAAGGDVSVVRAKM
eukprot:TRINITY_DN58475_c0_g1_i1.p1 TRINITY_DN58475_c0_g1~~TRINITY_DN58475_c0_g1_i1.p1  ORF type:complete len:191 (-),score=21.77 TRINITY_DN58475_c0_g1_i1:405-977(-)